jgi:hypothetical protein
MMDAMDVEKSSLIHSFTLAGNRHINISSAHYQAANNKSAISDDSAKTDPLPLAFAPSAVQAVARLEGGGYFKGLGITFNKAQTAMKIRYPIKDNLSTEDILKSAWPKTTPLGREALTNLGLVLQQEANHVDKTTTLKNIIKERGAKRLEQHQDEARQAELDDLMKTKKAKTDQEVLNGALQASQEPNPWPSMDDVDEDVEEYVPQGLLRQLVAADEGKKRAEWTSAPAVPKEGGGPSGGQSGSV